jgi:AraC family transcriptional regulator, transcriptional activator of the genes for pyochelin and ferripyochelin receptors
MNILSAAAYTEQFEAAIATNGRKTFGQRGFDSEIRMMDGFGTDWERYVELRPGLKLLLVDYDSHRDLNKWAYYDSESSLVSSFRLSGRYCTLTPGLLDLEEAFEAPGYHYLTYMPEVDRIEQWVGGDRYWDFVIYTDPQMLQQYCLGAESLPTPFQHLISHDQPPRFFQEVGRITPPMLALLQKLWIAPFQPPMQRLHLESCVLELLALQLNQWARLEHNILPVPRLAPVDIDRVYQARDILMAQLHQPPSPLDLAQQVNLTERNLQKGFQDIFGTTVFRYLHDCRMEQAKMLLCDRAVSVAAVANTVGYSHLGYFAAAFKKKFGMSPKAWQQS